MKAIWNVYRWNTDDNKSNLLFVLSLVKIVCKQWGYYGTCKINIVIKLLIYKYIVGSVAIKYEHWNSKYGKAMSLSLFKLYNKWNIYWYNDIRADSQSDMML